MQIVGGDRTVVVIAQAGQHVQPAKRNLILEVIAILLIAETVFLRGFKPQRIVIDLRVIRITHIDTRCGRGVTIMEVRVQLLVVKARQQMMFPVPQRDGSGDLVINVEAL